MNTKKSYYGYVLMVFSFLIYLFTVGVAGYGNGVVTTQIVVQEGWSQSIIGTATSMFQIGQVIGLMGLGAVYNKIGAKNCLVGGIAVSLAAYAVLAFIRPSGFLYTLMFVGCGIGAGTSLMACPALMNAWFERRKSFPMAVVLAAGTAGGFVMPIVATRLTSIDTSVAWICYGAFNLVAIIFAIIFVKQNPSDIGEIKDGKAWVEAHPLEKKEEVAEAVVDDKDEITAKEAYGSVQFYLLAIIMFIQRMLVFSFTSFAMIYAIQKGVAAERAAMLISVYSLTGFFGRLLAGGSDRIPLEKRIQNGITLLIMSAGMIILTVGTGEAMFMLAAVIVGTINGYQTSLFALVVGDFFGDKPFALMFSTYNTVGSVSGVVSPMLISGIYAMTGRYETAFILTAVLLVIAGIISFVAKPLVKKKA